MSTYSDERLKSNIGSIEDALSILNGIKGYRFTYTADKSNKKHVGLMAQEVSSRVPEAVSEDHQGFLSVSYYSLVALLVQAVNELSEEVKTLKEKIGKD